ncbi:Vasoactive intestinal polypeptide receptor [Chelonia mydas]|uniref:Vasoactive intestinal polypeptide receptor n=1 Tax=Chelonia mydas TaxID=8469 RepID=M7BRI7_CHEMY|nr:Vasoactive intestinal polypeptide receptor [Chelonia mydas]
MHPEILETIVKMEVNRLNFAVRGGRDFSKELLQAELAKGKASLSQKAKINPNLQLPGCGMMWDNITCWPSAAVGEVVVMPCPIYFIYFSTSLGNVTRNCTSQGWADMYPAPYAAACGYDTNSTPGVEPTFYDTVKTGYTIGYSLSLIALTAAMIILCLFRKLHCTRNYIHMHLFMSFIMRAIAVFIKDFILFESGESDHCSASSVGCKAAMVFFQYCIMANFFWLLVEGLYLHTLLVISFFSERKYFWWYILIGWGAPSVFITAWTIIKVHYDNIGCWEDIGESQYWLIIRAPIAVSILVNFILFICIIRILFQKLHSPDVGRNETSQYLSAGSDRSSGGRFIVSSLDARNRPLSALPSTPVLHQNEKRKRGRRESVSCRVTAVSTYHGEDTTSFKIPPPAQSGFPGIALTRPPCTVAHVFLSDRRLAKSTLLLIPLFGVHYIVFAFFPDNFKMEIKLVFELVLGSFQGFVGAVLYCFLNGEVQAELKRKWRRWHLERFLGSDMKYHHPSVGSNGTNFSTQISMLTKCSPKTRRCSSFQADFSLV